LEPRHLARPGLQVAQRIDPGAAQRLAANEQAALERRELWLSEGLLDGMCYLRGRLDPLAGAALRAAIDARCAPRPATLDGADLRSAARRRADAFVECLHLLSTAAVAADQVPGNDAGHDSGEDTSGADRSTVKARPAPRPQLVVTTDLATLRAGLTAKWASGSSFTDEGTHLSAGLVRQLACDAKVIPVVLGGSSQPVDVGRASYVVPNGMRRALIARDGGCTAPGCDRPPGWTDAHHLKHWADGGITALANLTLVCGFHHNVLHTGEWVAVMAEDGIVDWIPPPWIDPLRGPRRNSRFGLRVA
jgi:hypothetical protein